MRVSVPLRVLILEDSEDDALLITDELRDGGYEPAVERVETCEALESALRRLWDVVIADYRLPRCTGMDALETVRLHDPDIPFIIVSGKISEETAVEAMRAGAQDYVLKDNLARLSPAVDRELREARVRRERREAQEALARSEQILQSVIDSSSASIYLKDIDGRYLVLNDQAARILDARKEEAVGKTVYDLLRQDIAALREARDREVIENCAATEHEEAIDTSNGRRTFLTTRFPTYDAAGEIYGVGGISTDITERKKVEEALEDERRRLAALESVSEAGLSNLGIAQLLDRLAEQVSVAFNADSACIFTLDEEAGELVASAVYGIPGLVGRRTKMTERFAGEILARRRPVSIPDTAQHPQLLDDICAHAKALLGSPLIARGKVLGAIQVQSSEQREFTQSEIRLLQAMADRAALAVDNAQLLEDLQRSRNDISEALEREKHFSLLLQRALLPEAPEVGAGYDVAAEYVPAPFTGEIGGDFYDVFPIQGDKVGVLIGDVSGKGLEAAALAATTRSTIHAFVHQTASAAEALSKANAVIYSKQEGDESFATVFLLVIHLPTGTVHYSSAGHPSPILCGCDHRLEHLAYGQMPLGVIEAQTFTEHVTHLQPGDSLLLYTDGISEARRGSEMFELEGIESVARRCCRPEAAQLARDLLNDATEWAEGNLRDDAAVVVVARKPDQQAYAA